MINFEYEEEFADKPIFTIKEDGTGKEYCIYLDGRVEGFDKKIHIYNRIPSAITHAFLAGQEQEEFYINKDGSSQESRPYWSIKSFISPSSVTPR